MSHCYNDDDDNDDNDDDVMATKGRPDGSIWPTDPRQFSFQPEQFVEEQKYVDPAPKNVNALFTTQKKSICLLALWPQSNFIGTCEVSWGSSSTKWHIICYIRTAQGNSSIV